LIPTGGSVDIAIRTPDGALLDLGPSAITGLDAGAIATDRTNGEFAFSRYGRHTITVDGTLADADGIQYRIGGDYSAWVAMPLDLRVATLPGTPAVRGEAFTMAVRCYPPVPAKIRATQWVSVAGSNEVKEHGYEVQASPAGEFIPALRNTRNRWWGKGLVLFEDAGEYRLRVQGSYESADGTLYLGQWESANVVVPPTGSARTTPALVAAFGGLGATVAPTLDQGLDFPLVATDLLFIAPGRRPFDPWLYGHGEPDLIERRLIPAGNLVDLTSGQRGFVPASGTPQGYPAQGYPESRDRMGLTYAWAVAPGLKPRSVVRDGTADGDRRPVGPALEWNAPARYTLFGGVSLFDATLEQGAQGAYAGGLIVSDKVNRFSLLPTGSDADALSDRPIPYLHQWAIPAGTVLPQGAAFSPQCYVFPPQSGTLHVTLKRAAGPERYLEVPIDARGVAGSLQGFAPLEQPGVYTVAPSAQLAETMLKPDPYQIYVAGRDPDFTMTLQQPPGMRVDWGDALTLSGSIAGEGYQQAELFFTLVVDGELIEQGQVIAATRDFRVDFHLPRAAALLPGFDPAGPHLADLTLFAIPLTGEGELSSCALRATIRDGKLEWSNTPPAKKKKKFWDIF
ncbi:MAG TPA: hypothetical protein VEI97_17615, partial [bacterium]|nr:hypothetical protein [bacterium]